MLGDHIHAKSPDKRQPRLAEVTEGMNDPAATPSEATGPGHPLPWTAPLRPGDLHTP